MSGKWLFVALAVLCSIDGDLCLAGPVLVGATASGVFYDIDLDSGVVANRRETGLFSRTNAITGLAFAQSGILYAQSGRFGGGGDRLFTVDLVTLEATVAIDPVPVVASDVEYNERTGTLLGLALADASLFTLSPVTGHLQLIRTALGNSGPLASDATGRAFAVITGQDYFVNPRPHGNDRVVEIDPMTGAALSEWVLDVDMTFASSTFVGDTLMILDHPFGEASTLYAFDPAEGSLSVIGSANADERLVALAYIPEPTTFPLLLAAFGWFASRRQCHCTTVA